MKEGISTKGFEKLVAILLAAGHGKRMKSKTAKVLHPLAGIPMILYPLNLLADLNLNKVIVVVGHQADQVEKTLIGRSVQTVLQEKPRGTGDAVLTTKTALVDFKGSLLILNGDTPLIQPKTLTDLLALHQTEQATVTLLTADLADPTGYGRVIRGNNKTIIRIVEEKDATSSERAIPEINAGTYLVESPFLFKALSQISPENQQKEYYLTDMIKIAHEQGVKICGLKAKANEVRGINSRADLAEAEKILQQQIARRFMDAGVTLIDPARIRIDATVTIGADTVLHPDVTLEGETTIGEGAILHACRIKNSRIGSGVLIRDHSIIEDAMIESDVVVGPFAHLRPGTVLRKGAKIGNFVETKKCDLGEGSKANHLSYLGDARIGKNVNIGAGTITCNFDGEKKQETVIEDDVFVGSDTQFIAPVTIGARSTIAAGSTITKDVSPDALAISRVKQENLAGWAKRPKKPKNKKEG